MMRNEPNTQIQSEELKMNDRYKIASIALDSDGVFWIYYYGDVPEQGGSRFGLGSMGLHTVEDATNVLKSIIEMNLDTYKKLIKEKREGK